jgi:hypothetical protein
MEKKEEMIGHGVNINVNVPEQHDHDAEKISAIGKVVERVGGVSWRSIMKICTIIVIFFTSLFVYKSLTNESLVNALAHNIVSKTGEFEESNLKIRSETVTPKIQKELKILCYTLNADRAFLFELHNGKKNASGLPFRFADMSYEEPNEEKNVERVAMQFQDIPLTLYKYPHYLAQHKYLCGTVGDISKIDNGFAEHINRVGGKYLGMIYLTNNGIPLGFLCVSFHEKPEVSDTVIKQKLEQYGKVISLLLDLNVLMEN